MRAPDHRCGHKARSQAALAIMMTKDDLKRGIWPRKAPKGDEVDENEHLLPAPNS